ncbi:MAG: hypothetical protein DMG59_23275, partial [Acidobacteria bacterium]
PGDTTVHTGQFVTVDAIVANAGPAGALNTSTALTVVATGQSVAGTCTRTTPATVNIPGDPLGGSGQTTQKYSYNCGPVSGNGTLTFKVSASGVYLNGAGTVTATAPQAASNVINVN